MSASKLTETSNYKYKILICVDTHIVFFFMPKAIILVIIIVIIITFIIITININIIIIFIVSSIISSSIKSLFNIELQKQITININ